MKKIIMAVLVLFISASCLAGDKGAAEAYYKQGKAFSDAHEYQKAIPEFEKAIEADPSRAEFYHGIGTAYIRLRKINEAVEYLEKGIKAKPDYAENYVALGSAYYNLGQQEKSIDIMEKAKGLYQKQGNSGGKASVEQILKVIKQK